MNRIQYTASILLQQPNTRRFILSEYKGKDRNRDLFKAMLADYKNLSIKEKQKMLNLNILNDDILTSLGIEMLAILVDELNIK